MGGNPAEAHPVSLQHLLEGKELNRANMIVIDPRLTRTAAHATEYVRIRSGTDIPVIWGMLWHIFENGWEDKEFIEQRVYGMDDVRKEVEKWTPEEVERVTGVPGEQLERVAKMFATEKPATLIWCMGATQHTVGTANVRAFCIAAAGDRQCRRVRHRRQHLPRPLQRAGRDRPRPRYRDAAALLRPRRRRVAALVPRLGSRLRLDAGALRHRKQMMETPGIPSTRWFDATMLPKDQVDAEGQPQGHDGLRATAATPSPACRKRPRASRSSTCWSSPIRIRPPGRCSASARTTPTCCRSAPVRDATARAPRPTARSSGASRSSSRSSSRRTTTRSCICWRRSSASPTRCSRTSRSRTTCRSAEDILREINRGGWSTGYCGQSPERLKRTWSNQDKFDLVTLRAPKDMPEIGGDYYGLPWPCWGTPELQASRHATSLYNTNLHVKDGGGTFRARFGVEREEKLPDGTIEQGTTCWPKAPTRSDSEIKDGYPEFTYGVLKKLGWDEDLTASRARRRSSGSAATTPTRVSLGDRPVRRHPARRAWSMAASPTATARRAPTRGTCPTRSRCIASRSTRRGPTWSRKYPTLPDARAVPRAQPRLRRCRRPRSTRASPSNSRSS